MEKEEYAKRILAALDKDGPPYVVPCWYTNLRVPINYEMAKAIAASSHPSRVLAVTSVYRYGKFTMRGPIVNVHMMGQHIAAFTPAGVTLYARGYHTQSTAEALSDLTNRVWFFNRAGVLHYRAYGTDRTEHRFTEGQLFPYETEEATK